MIGRSFAEGEIVSELYCEKCGLAQITEDEAGNFEEFFSHEGRRLVYVDICTCRTKESNCENVERKS